MIFSAKPRREPVVRVRFRALQPVADHAADRRRCPISDFRRGLVHRRWLADLPTCAAHARSPFAGSPKLNPHRHAVGRFAAMLCTCAGSGRPKPALRASLRSVWAADIAICGQQVACAIALHWAPGINRQLPDASRSRIAVCNPNGSGVTPRIQSSMRSVSISTKAAFARSCSLGKYTL